MAGHDVIRARQEAEPPDEGEPGRPLRVQPLAVLSQTFPARASSLPAITEFVRHSLVGAPFGSEESRRLQETKGIDAARVVRSFDPC